MYLMTDKAAALNRLRKLVGLKQNGKLDGDLKNELKKYSESGTKIEYKDYKLILEKSRARKHRKYILENAPNLSKAPYSFGDSGSSIMILNTLLYDLSKYYRLNLRSPLGSVYSKRTEAAVSELRRIFNLEAKESCDDEFLVRLLKEHKSIYLR